jgi:hypothetical protein
MVITSIPTVDKGEVLFRFTRDTCFDGVDYGPNHVDMPVPMGPARARTYEANGRGHIEPANAPRSAPKAELPSEPVAARRSKR